MQIRFYSDQGPSSKAFTGKRFGNLFMRMLRRLVFILTVATLILLGTMQQSTLSTGDWIWLLFKIS